MSDFWSIQKGPITKDSLAYLSGASNLEDWNSRCRTIKRINGGVYPPDWYSAIVASGFAEEVLAKFGESSHLKVEDKVDFSALNSTSVADAMLAMYESEKDTSTVITVRGRGREMRVVLEHEETLEENGETFLALAARISFNPPVSPGEDFDRSEKGSFEEVAAMILDALTKNSV